MSIRPSIRSCDRKRRRHWSLSALEPRLMLAADAGAAAETATVGKVDIGSVDSEAEFTASRQSVERIVFIDGDVDQAEMLAASADDAEVVLISKGQDPIAQISKTLAGRRDVSSVHIVSHGEAGKLQLAGTVIDETVIRANAQHIAAWSRALHDDADILLYGCSVGAGSEGRSLIETLAEFTGADVAASIDRTGATADADWQLERMVGRIEAGLAFQGTVLASYQHTLPITIRAAGQEGVEEMSLQIDGTTVQTWTNIGGDVGSGQYQTFTYNGGAGVTGDQVRVTFNNDLYEPPNVDRNLRVDSITINGVTIETEDPNVYGTGTWTGQGITPGNNQSEFLHTNGFFQYYDASGGGQSTFAIVDPSITVDESAGVATVQISRTGDLSSIASIDYQTLDGSAIAGEDYTATINTVTFNPNESVKNVFITINDDGDPESTQSFTLTLDNPSGADLGAPQAASITILDNDSSLLDYADFQNPLGIVTNGDASIVGNKLQVTSDATFQTGSAFYETPFVVDNDTSFQTAFSFEMTGGSGAGGADGILFVLQNSPDGASALGRGGSGVGYDLISNSFAVELDTWQNAWDQFNDEVGVIAGGNIQNQIAQAQAPYNLNSGGVYYAWIDYDGATDALSVFVSDTDTKPVAATLQTTIALDAYVGNQFYAGFTSSNYDRPNAHRILSWSMNLQTPSGSGQSTFAIADASIAVNESAGAAVVQISRTGDLSNSASIEYRTSNGSALAGLDYTTTINTAFFDPNESVRNISIPINDDDDVETTESFTFTIENPIDAILGIPQTATITILDNDATGSQSTFQIVDSTITVNESAGVAVVQISRTGDLSSSATIDYQTFNQSATAGQDYTTTNDTVTFTANQTIQDIQIPIIDDGDTEPTETFSFTIDNPGDADLGVPRTATITILDNETSLPNYADFQNPAGIVTNGGASIDGNVLQITSDATFQTGSAFYDTPIVADSNTSFQTAFAFEMTGGFGPGGADGILFVLQNAPAGATAIGRGGSGVGYDLISNSFAVEFDTWQNSWDLYNDEIGVVADGVIQNQIAQVKAPFNLNFGSVYYAWVDYNGISDQLNVYVSETDTKPAAATLQTTIVLDAYVGNQFYAGFTSSNYDRPNAHRILSWTMNLETPPADPPVNPSGDVTSVTVASGYAQPTGIDWSPDGLNMYVAEKAGRVNVVRDGNQISTPLIDISNIVNNASDRGLLDIAVHPDLLSGKPYLYLLYTYDPPEVFANASHPFAGPDKLGNRAGQLMRVTLDSSTDYTTMIAGSEEIILGTASTWDNFNGFVNSVFNFAEPEGGVNPDGSYIQDFVNSDSTTHTIGSLAFGTDKNLFVSIGDGASYNDVDARAVRVQDITNLSGKILRIDPVSGAGVAGNPFYESSNANSNQSKVYQLGLRNPFRISVDSNDGRLFIGDVGWTNWEEVNTGPAGTNFGWPYYEGGQGVSFQTGGGYALLPEAQAFYASGTQVTPGSVALNHAADGINAIVLGDVVRGGDLGQQYEGDVFFNDLGQGIVRNASIDANGVVTNVDVFATGAQYVVTMRQGPDGSLYFVDLVDGIVGKWQIV